MPLINLGKRLNALLYAEKINGRRVKHGGTVPTPHVERMANFHVGLFGWGDYKPLHQFHVIPTISVKDQGNRNTCGWNSVVAQKEVDENCELSVSSLVRYAKSKYLLSGDGLSNLLANQQAVKDFGVAEARFFNEAIPDWPSYSDVSKLTAEVVNNAAMHKDQTYWEVSTKNDILKLLDQNRILATGLEWFTGFNMNGGFAAPWIISKFTGVDLGGHAFIMKGYVFGYKGLDASGHLVTGSDGVDVFVFQNSYGSSWGATVIDENNVTHRGVFFITMDFFYAKGQGYERYVQLDIALDVAKFVIQYNAFNVKGSGPAIYWVADGTKHAYPDMLTYVGYNGMQIKYENVDDAVLAACPSGPDMDLKAAPLFPIMQASVQPLNYEEILKVLMNKRVGTSYSNVTKTWSVNGQI